MYLFTFFTRLEADVAEEDDADATIELNLISSLLNWGKRAKSNCTMSTSMLSADRRKSSFF